MNPVVAARADEQTARAYWAAGRGDSERAFRLARRHSKRVRRLRVAIPVAVAVVLLAFVLWTWLNPVRLLLDKLPVSLGDTVISGSTITMQAPRLSGFMRDSRAYELTAASAAQDLTRPDVVTLKEIRAKLEMQDKSMTELTARNGTYDSKKEVMLLGDDVYLSTGAYKAWLNNAQVDMRTGNVVSDKPVTVEMLQGTLNANRLQVTENGDLITFDGGVKMNMQLQSTAAAEQGAR